MKIGYFADGPWSHLALEKLVKCDYFEICFIVPRYDTQDPVLKEWADKLSVDFLLFKNINHQDSIKSLQQYNADLFISMSFNQILKSEILKVAPLGFINCHAGELPFYRGRNILNWALINDAKSFGVTVHYIDEGVDTGDIIEQSVELITDQDNYATLLNRAIILCADLLYKAVLKIENNSVIRIKQVDKHPVGFYCGYRRDGDEWIDWSWSSRRIFNFIRGISKPAPCARALYNKQEVIIEESSIIENSPSYIDTPGTIVGKNSDNFIVKTGDSTIKLSKVYFASRQERKINFSVGQRFVNNSDSMILQLISRVSNLEDKIRKMSTFNEGDLE